MRRWNRHAYILALALALSILAGCGAAAASATPTPTPILPTATPTAGTPQVSSLNASIAGLGTFAFRLNASRTGISDFAVTFANYVCGDLSAVTGTIDVANQASWPITSGAFNLPLVLDTPQSGIVITIHQGFTFSSNNGAGLSNMTITGSFDGTGMHASGTWSVGVSGSGATSCPGTWQSS